MSEPAILLEEVRYSYPGHRALDGVSLAVPRGAVMGLLGPNGAGKTTLMHLLNGLVPPEAGRLRVLGLEPWRERVPLQRRMASVPETPQIYPWMTVRAYGEFCRRNFSGWDVAYVAGKLDEYGIPADRRFDRLSRGQQGLVSLLAALGRRGEVLLLDDPTLGLDVLARRQLYRTIVEELAEREVTILFATHLPAEVEGVLTHAAFLHDSRIALQGTVEELKQQASADGAVPTLEELAVRQLGGGHVA
jgi:ABC-2 type transport system ATP-binding protein